MIIGWRRDWRIKHKQVARETGWRSLRMITPILVANSNFLEREVGQLSDWRIKHEQVALETGWIRYQRMEHDHAGCLLQF